jgi:hypothetical protein
VLSREVIPKSFFECGTNSNNREEIATAFDPVLSQPRNFIALSSCHTSVRIWNRSIFKERWYGAKLVRFSGRLRRLSKSRRKLRLSRCAVTHSCQLEPCSLSFPAPRFALGSNRCTTGRPLNDQDELHGYKTIHQSYHHRLWFIKNRSQWRGALFIVRRRGIQWSGHPFTWKFQGQP